MNNLIKNRRSVRSFLDQDISDDVVLEIVKASMQAPSARNQRPWLIHIERDKKVIEKMSQEFTSLKFAHNASCVLVFLMKTDESISVMAPQDMASSVTMALLEAENNHVGACWGGVYPREERMNLAREVFNLKDKNYVPFAIVPLGLTEDKNYYFVDRFEKERLI